ncbi:MAG TPA: hypothetical protein VMF89_12250, partial [Polyangiales bacterium]|nr:hypothetical protein [Polyangiales bacterium]
MNRLLSLAFVLSVLAAILASCGKESAAVEATAIVVSVHTDIQSEFSHVEATVFDRSGEKQGDRATLELATHPLPFSFTVVPTLAHTNDFMIVVRAKDAAGNDVAEAKAIASFERESTLTIHVWLRERCLGRLCEARQTCRVSADEAECADIPTLVGVRTRKGEELDAGVTIETSPSTTADGATTVDDAATAVTNEPSFDSATPAPVLDAAVGSEAAVPAATGGPCLGSPSQAVCVDAVLHQCNEQGQSVKSDVCGSARQCQLGLTGRICASCDPGARRCSSVRLERCAQDGQRWELAESCASESLCNPVAGACVAGACTATTRACMGDDL